MALRPNRPRNDAFGDWWQYEGILHSELQALCRGSFVAALLRMTRLGAGQEIATAFMALRANRPRNDVFRGLVAIQGDSSPAAQNDALYFLVVLFRSKSIPPLKRMGHPGIKSVPPLKWMGHPGSKSVPPSKRMGHPGS